MAALNDDMANFDSLVNDKGTEKKKEKVVAAEVEMPVEKEKKQKIDFNQLSDKKVQGDAVYEDTKQRIRDKKAARKETEKGIKANIEKEVNYMGS
jgi:hypothetical protein